MRVRLVAELVKRWWQYLDTTYMDRGYNKAGNNYISQLTLYCTNGETPEDRFKAHVFETRNDGASLGIFHVAAAATVLQRNIRSVYPRYGGHISQVDLNRVFLPRVHSNRSTGHIMWTHTCGVADDPRVWAPNHFVLLLPQKRLVYLEFTYFCHINICISFFYLQM